MTEPVAPWYRTLRGFGVTGTNEKTSTSLLLNAVLASQHQPTAAVTTMGFYWNTQRLAAPLSGPGMAQLLQRCAAKGGRDCVLEMSSEALALGIAKRYPVEVGVFTNLSHDHLDAHVSPEHYLAAKAQLFMGLPSNGAAVLNAADPCSELLQEVLPPGLRTITYGLTSRGPVPESTALRAKRVTVSARGTQIELAAHALLEGVEQFSIRAVGEVYAENALAAFGAGVVAGIAPAAIAAALEAAAPPPGRFEIIAAAPTVVIDYAHTPDALKRSLATARKLTHGRVLLVFGAGGERDKAKRPLLGEAARDADAIWLTNDNPRSEDPAAIAQAIAAGLTGHASVTTLLSRKHAIEQALKRCGAADVLLIAGKGHERTQVGKDSSKAFSDRDVALRALGRA